MWTEPVIADLKKLHKEHYSSSEIATRLNARYRTSFSRNAVIGKLHRLGIKDNGTGYRNGRTRKRGPKKKVMNLSMRIKQKFVEAAKPLPKPVTIGNAVSVTLDELQSFHCRYPVHDQNEPAKFCGATRQSDSSYCPDHHEVCHTKKVYY